jgi:CMP-N-acetylneuraminic acid synthetase
MKVVAVIPARQWSRGTPGKNRDGFDSTLIAARQIANVGVIVTTDDPMLWIDEWEVTTIRRPQHLEDGESGPVIAHALQDVDADVVVVLQPSSPTLNRAEYCRAALHLLRVDPDVTSVVSVVPWGGEPPQKAVYINDGVLHIPRQFAQRQNCAPAYRRDGTLYAVRATYAKAGDLYGPRPVPLLVTPRDSVTVD